MFSRIALVRENYQNSNFIEHPITKEEFISSTEKFVAWFSGFHDPSRISVYHYLRIPYARMARVGDNIRSLLSYISEEEFPSIPRLNLVVEPKEPSDDSVSALGEIRFEAEAPSRIMFYVQSVEASQAMELDLFSEENIPNDFKRSDTIPHLLTPTL